MLDKLNYTATFLTRKTRLQHENNVFLTLKHQIAVVQHKIQLDNFKEKLNFQVHNYTFPDYSKNHFF